MFSQISHFATNDLAGRRIDPPPPFLLHMDEPNLIYAPNTLKFPNFAEIRSLSLRSTYLADFEPLT